MDFSTPRPSFVDAPRVQFGKHAQHQEQAAPRPFKAKAALRRMAMFREAHDLLSALPAPGESLHAIQSGTLDLCVILMAMLDLHPAPCRTLRIATLAFAKRNAVELLGGLESKKIGRLVLLASHFHAAHYRPLHEWFCGELAAFPGSKIAVARSHAKVVCCDFSDGIGLILSGSANLRSNHNLEALVLTSDRTLHDWYAKWIDAQVNHAKNDRE